MNDMRFGLNFVEGTTVAQSTSCPITGDYSGVVPGTSGLCAKVASDCNNPDIMFYSVSSCENRTHVYEGMYCPSYLLFSAVVLAVCFRSVYRFDSIIIFKLSLI